MALDPELVRTDALGSLAGELALRSGDAVRFELVPPRMALNVRGPATEGFTEVIEEVFGVAPPLEPNRWTGGRDRAAVWLGPDEWLLVGQDGEAGATEQRLREASPEEWWLSVTDVSHNYTCLCLAGPCGRELLAKGCSLDLHPSEFGAFDCAQTLLAKTRVILRAVDEGEAIELWIRNSLAPYTAEWLLDASAEFR